jgi:hypothetical protein
MKKNRSNPAMRDTADWTRERVYSPMPRHEPLERQSLWEARLCANR